MAIPINVFCKSYMCPPPFGGERSCNTGNDRRVFFDLADDVQCPVERGEITTFEMTTIQTRYRRPSKIGRDTLAGDYLHIPRMRSFRSTCTVGSRMLSRVTSAVGQPILSNCPRI